MSVRETWAGDPASSIGRDHRALYFAEIGKELAALVPSSDALVLDYRCGDAFTADFIAAKCARLYLYDVLPKVEAALRKRYAGSKIIVVLNENALQALPDASLDMIICNSVFQYLSREECAAVVTFAATKLKLGGRFVVTDILPPHVDALTDSWAMVEFAYRGGFLLAALRGFAKTLFSRSRAPHRPRSLTTFAIPEMQRLLSTRGFETRRLERNIGHNQARMTFIGKRV